MEDIELKLKELWSMLQTIPSECIGAHNSENRYRFMKIRIAIHSLIDDKKQ